MNHIVDRERGMACRGLPFPFPVATVVGVPSSHFSAHDCFLPEVQRSGCVRKCNMQELGRWSPLYAGRINYPTTYLQISSASDNDGSTTIYSIVGVFDEYTVSLREFDHVGFHYTKLEIQVLSPFTPTSSLAQLTSLTPLGKSMLLNSTFSPTPQTPQIWEAPSKDISFSFFSTKGQRLELVVTEFHFSCEFCADKLDLLLVSCLDGVLQYGRWTEVWVNPVNVVNFGRWEDCARFCWDSIRGRVIVVGGMREALHRKGEEYEFSGQRQVRICEDGREIWSRNCTLCGVRWKERLETRCAFSNHSYQNYLAILTLILGTLKTSKVAIMVVGRFIDDGVIKCLQVDQSTVAVKDFGKFDDVLTMENSDALVLLLQDNVFVALVASIQYGERILMHFTSF
nr:hypothetical protein Iba_chr03eCG1120 [Ipomoea batatas]